MRRLLRQSAKQQQPTNSTQLDSTLLYSIFNFDKNERLDGRINYFLEKAVFGYIISVLYCINALQGV